MTMTTLWQQQTLSGGLPLLQHSRPGAGLLAARLWIRGGSSMDPQGQRGAMQLLAGTMTRGAGELDADGLAELVEGRGAALRAEANEDSLVIGLKCASDDASDLLPLLLAMACEPSLESSQVELERQLNLQSLQRQREDPFQLAHDGLRHQLYGDGPYGHDPLGMEAELDQLGGSELQPLAATLGSRGAQLVLCGDLDPALVEGLDQQLQRRPWSTQAPGRSAGPQAQPGAPLQAQEQDTEQLVLMLGCATVPLGHDDALALRLLQAHLGLGMSSRLFVVLREERGLAYDVGVHMPARCGATPFVWHLSSSAERAAEACGAVLTEWQRLLEQPLSTEELQLAVAKYRGQEALGRQTCGQVADRQALLLGYGLGGDHVERCLEQATLLTPDDLLQAARRWLQRPHLSLCGPAPALAAATRAWEQQLPTGWSEGSNTKA
jgi:predicted Zn-dependent peptidase